MDLATIVWRFIGKRPTSAEEEVCQAFAAQLNASPECDAYALRDELLAEFGEVPGRVVTLIERSAKYVINRPPLDVEPLIGAARSYYEQRALKLRDRLQHSTIVKGFIPPQWFTGLDTKLAQWDVRQPLDLPDHLLFLSYAQDLLLYQGEPDLIATIDAGVHQLRTLSGKTLNNKLKDLARSRDSFVPTVFELLVLTAFANAGQLVDYEPRISTGVPEARVMLAGHHALIEARAKMEHYRGGGMFNPARMGHRLAAKAREKYAGQLAGATEPVILFMSLDAYVVQDIEPEAMLAELLQDQDSRVLSAIVFSDTYRAKNLKLWLHPDARHPLTDSMVGDFGQLVQLSEMVPSGHYLPRK